MEGFVATPHGKPPDVHQGYRFSSSSLRSRSRAPATHGLERVPFGVRDDIGEILVAAIQLAAEERVGKRRRARIRRQGGMKRVRADDQVVKGAGSGDAHRARAASRPHRGQARAARARVAAAGSGREQPAGADPALRKDAHRRVDRIGGSRQAVEAGDAPQGSRSRDFDELNNTGRRRATPFIAFKACATDAKRSVEDLAMRST